MLNSFKKPKFWCRNEVHVCDGICIILIIHTRYIVNDVNVQSNTKKLIGDKKMGFYHKRLIRIGYFIRINSMKTKIDELSEIKKVFINLRRFIYVCFYKFNINLNEERYSKLFVIVRVGDFRCLDIPCWRFSSYA